MGDRCYLQMYVAKSDIEKMRPILDWIEPSDLNDQGVPTGSVEIIDYEANYGLYDELEKMAGDEITFQGGHGEGGEYGPEVFVSFKGEYVSLPANRL
jgi:hypothetical protein